MDQSALAAALAVARRHGIRATRPRILRDYSNLLIHLSPAPVVARVATVTARVRTDTRRRLIDGAIETIRTQGIAGASARAIAGTAGVNQALIFYHFTGVDDLIVEACAVAAAARVEHYRARLSTVDSLGELLALGRELHATERLLGNTTVLAQVLAGAQANPALAEAARGGLRLWTAELTAVLTRLLADSPLAGLLDPQAFADAVSAGFIGLELVEAADPDGVTRGLSALAQLHALVEAVEDLGPVARRALRAKLRSTRRD